MPNEDFWFGGQHCGSVVRLQGIKVRFAQFIIMRFSELLLNWTEYRLDVLRNVLSMKGVIFTRHRQSSLADRGVIITTILLLSLSSSALLIVDLLA